jgi:hypothetical protein
MLGDLDSGASSSVASSRDYRGGASSWETSRTCSHISVCGLLNDCEVCTFPICLSFFIGISTFLL